MTIKPKNYREVRAELQRFVQQFEEIGRPFTQGAAEYLATAAAKEILQHASKTEFAGQVEEAKKSFPLVAQAITEQESKQVRPKIYLKEARQLRASEVFCRIRPWC